MRSLLIALAVVFAAAPVFASEKTDVVASVHQFIDGFNKGDAATALAACASPVSIVDEFPPHAWQGRTACKDWSNDYNTDAKKKDLTDGIVTLGKPRRVDVTGDRAYAVVPATYTYKLHGKHVTESGAFFTVALRRAGSRWLITGWTWTRT
ncbi:MAG: hypothetical protein M3N19_05695 [Candidatus Eremiobacteraeota bacterium]|nr:hypothetical protein [Candidatus Eremiobacteraeota bacterium]